MRLQKSINRILELLSIFHFEVEKHNRTGHFDINLLSEDVMIPLLRDLYGCPVLRNLNRERRNFPGLDLADDQARMAFQITSDPSIEKVKKTLAQIAEHKHHLRYDHFYIYILAKKQSKYAKKTLQEITKGIFDFDPDKHIIDSNDLGARIKECDVAVINRIEETLEVHFSNPKKYFIRPAAEKKENITLNIMPIQFPCQLFIGKLISKREEVLEKAKQNGYHMSPRSSQRKIIWADLAQRGLFFSPAWVVRSDEIITFHDMNDEKLPLAALVDPATVEPIDVDNYISDGKGGGQP